MHLKPILLMGALMLRFRNGTTLVRQMRAGEPSPEAVLWDGTRIAHPAGREGLLEALQEIWLERIYTEGFYQQAKNDVIVDAGANVGVFSMYIARRNRECRVVALEPFTENFRYLQENVVRAGLRNVTCLQIALGGDFGQAQMRPVGTRSLDHVLVPNQVPVAVFSEAGEIRGPQPASGSQLGGSSSHTDTGTINVIPLSGVFELAAVEEIDLMKVDIEGSERDVFASATPEVLRRIKRIAMEYHDCLVPGTLDVLRGALAPTHEIMIMPSQLEGCGVLRARRRDLNH